MTDPTTGIHLTVVAQGASWELLEALRALVTAQGGVVVTARVEPLDDDEKSLYETRRRTT